MSVGDRQRDGNLADARARDVERAVHHDLDGDAVILQHDATDAPFPALLARDEVRGHGLALKPDAAGDGAGRIDPVEEVVGDGFRHLESSRNRCASGRETTCGPRLPASGW